MEWQSFSGAKRALRVKRRTLSKEITDILKDALSAEGISKEVFDEKRVYIEQCMGEIVTSKNDCIGLIDDVEEKGEITDVLNEQLDGLWVQKQLFFDLEAQIVQKSVHLADMKNVELVQRRRLARDT